MTVRFGSGPPRRSAPRRRCSPPCTSRSTAPARSGWISAPDSCSAGSGGRRGRGSRRPRRTPSPTCWWPCDERRNPMRRSRLAAAAVVVTALATSCGGPRRASSPLVVGAMYPTSGSQGPGGVEEYRGVVLAAQLANELGGVDGHPVAIRPVDAQSADAAPGAVAALAADGARFVLGSYGSTISAPAAIAADRRGMLFWETGAVGYMPATGRGRLVFRVSPSGLILGASAMDFVTTELAPRWHRSPSSLRFAVA